MSVVKKLVRDVFRTKFPNLPQADVLTFAIDCDRYIEFEGKYYSPLINTLEESFERRGLECISISRVNSEKKEEKTHGRVYSPEGAFARALLFKRFRSLFNKNKYTYSNYEERIWLKILKLSKVKAVVGITPSRELCTACHQLGVWVADIQHGVISDSHDWYGANFRKNDPRTWVPDAFLCWDTGAVDTITKWTTKTEIEVRLIGNPWINRFRNPLADDRLVNHMKEKYSLPKNGKKNILISLQWDDSWRNERYIDKALEEFILKNLDNYNWYFRLHPNMVHGFAKDDGKKFFQYFNATFPEGTVECKKATEMPLPLLLSMIDGHITWFSSVCIEAAYFGVRSLLLDERMLEGGEWQDYYRDLTNLDYVDRFKGTYEKIDHWINTRLNEKCTPLADFSDNYEALVVKVENECRN